MTKTLVASLLLFASVSLHAQDAGHAGSSSGNGPASDNIAAASNGSGSSASHGGWTGSGEFGYAAARGNKRADNANAKLGLNQENEEWKNSFFLTGMRSKGDVSVTDSNGNTVNKFSTTANRYDLGASIGYKLDPRSYIVSAARYEHDDFGANLWQSILSLGYGYIALKDQTTSLSFEIGPGYKRYRPADLNQTIAGVETRVRQHTQNETVARGLVNFKYRITDNTAFENTLLLEAGSKDKYYQNDAGLSVNMTQKIALKLGFQVRYHTDTQPGIKNTDTLTTTNLVYTF